MFGCSYFNLISLILLLNIRLSIEKSCRINTDDGNLEIQVEHNKNISFKTTGEGSVRLNGFDLLKAAKLATNVSSNINFYKRVASIAYQRVNGINDAIFGPSGLTQRIKLLEGGSVSINSSISSSVDILPTIRRLTRRVNLIQRRVKKLQLLLTRNECDENPCKNGGTCQDLFNNYLCVCPKTWEGPNCDTDVNECAIFAGTDLGCQNGATCINKHGGYECHCAQGYYGLHCMQRILDCNSGSSEICGHGTCINQKNGIKCICDQGWTTDGKHPACTVDVNECDLKHPKCSVNPPVPCINVPGSFYCGSCPHGYTGNGYYCADINECDMLNGGCSTNPLVQCINTPGSRLCGSCPPGYIGNGDSCTYQGSVCAVDNGGCHPSASCKSNPHISLTYVQCICPNGYTGNGIGPNGCIRFNNTLNSCTPNPCEHGTCQPTLYSYYCVCNTNYTGRNCNIAIKNSCIPNPCQNGGTCKTLIFRYYCVCPTGFRGRTCQLAASEACGGNFIAESGTIKYPTTNSTSLQTYVSCAWYIRTNISMVLNVTFKRFNLENVNDCTKNWVQMHDGNTIRSPKIGRFCGTTLPKNGSVVTLTNLFYLWMRLLDAKPGTGFELSWKSIKPVCEEFINVTSHGILKSPGSPGLYPNNRDCFWFLRVPPGNRIQFHFFSLEIGSNKNCDRDYIAFKQTEPPYNILAQYCNTTHPEPFTSPDSMVTVHFHSDETENYQGFQISYSMISAIPGCGGMYTKSKGQIQSPVLLKDYGPDIYCGYSIKLNKNARIKLTFLMMNFKSSSSCIVESLTLYEKNSDESSLIGKYCSDNLPGPISSNGNEIYIVFQTNMINENVGFQIYYETICGGIYNEPSGTIRPIIFTDKCIYEIILQPGKIISMTMFPEEIGTNSTKIFNYCDYIEIRDGFNENSTLIDNFCKNPLETIVTTYNHAVIMFKNFKGQSRTFNYTAIDIGCGGILKEMKGTISSTNFNEAIKAKRYCNWVLLAPSDHIIRVTWLQFNIEDSPYCGYDYVQIFDNNTAANAGESLGKFCGTDTPPTLMSTSNIVTIRYHMDETITLDGITFSYLFIHEQSVCGGQYFSNYGIIKSPGYPSNYPTSKLCVWTITVNQGQQVRLNVTHFELEKYNGCAYDYLEIRSGSTSSSPLLGKFCGKDIPNIIPAHSNQIYLKFKTDMSQTFSGFAIIWDATTTGCGGTLTSTRGSIISPYYPESYHNNALCEWKIIANAGSKINLVISDFDIEYHVFCALDYVEVFEGLGRTAQKIGRYCSPNSYPHLISSNSSNMMIKFKSDRSMSGRGFKLLYSAMCNNTIKGFRGTIESPDFPNIYDGKLSCQWEIEVYRGNKINITFSHYKFLAYDALNKNCHLGYIDILNFDPEVEEWKSYLRHCNKNIPPLITVPFNRIRINYVISSSFIRSNFRLEWSNFGCGSSRLTHPEGTLTSPNFPNGYPENTECVWIIDSGYGKSIELTFHYVDFEITGYCSYDFVSVYNGPDNTYPLLTKICHEIDSSVIVTASSNIMTVHFESDTSYTGKGFNATYKFIDSKCGGTLNSRSGSISSPNYPKNFNAGDMCEWLIQIPENYLINFTITDIDFMNNRNCTGSDYIKIYDGPTAAYPVLSKSCYKKEYFISSSNTLFVEMKTSYATKGFVATYTTACGARVESQSSGIINFTNMYMPDFGDNCTFTIISLNPAQHVHVTFTSMNVYYSCYENFTDIIIYDGETEDGPVLGRYCGSKIPPKITSTGSAIHIVTTSTNIFSLSYSVIDSTCGGTLHAWGGTFTSPNYPNIYPPNIDCEWFIKISPGNQVSLSFEAFNLIKSDYCNEDYLEIRQGSNNGKLLGTYCGDSRPSTIKAFGSLWIFFRSNKREEGDATSTGFMADFQYVRINEIVGSSGTITTPLYPKIYDHRESVKWQIMVRPSHKILLTFKDFYFDNSVDYCYAATLNIYDGPDDNHPSLGSLCGHLTPKPISTSSNLVYIVIDNEMSSVGSRLLLEWKEVAFPSLMPPENIYPTYDSHCGSKDVIDLSNATTFNFTSPGYPNGYNSRLKCEWIFSTTPENHLQIFFFDVALENLVYSAACIFDYVDIYTGLGGIQNWKLLERICLPNATEIENLITSNYMKVIFRTDSHLNQTGFLASVFQVCGGNLTEPNGIISVGIYKYFPIGLTECQWTITARPGSTIEIRFLEYDLEKDSKGACVDYVLLKNGIFADSPILGDGKYCNKEKLPTLQTTGKYAYIKYKSPKLKPLKFSYKEVSVNCGGEITLFNYMRSVNITSPNYPNIPNPNSECAWIIRGPPGESLLLDFIDRFDLTPSYECNKEYVEVRDGATKNSPLLGRYCNSKPSSISSTDNVLFVNFLTDVDDPRNGFKAKISIAKCGGTIRGDTETIKSPNYGTDAASYHNNIECVWHIIGPHDHTLSFTFDNIGLVQSPNCSKDYIEIYNVVSKINSDPISDLVDTRVSDLIDRYCSINSDNITTRSNEAVVKYVATDIKQKFTGFSLTFNSNQDACGGTLEQPSGIIESPGYPLTNHYDRDCEWKIIVPKGRRIKLELLDIDIDESSSFHEQGLVLFTGNVRLAHILPYKLKSTNVQNIRTTDNTGIIYFWSHHVSNHRGFRISFSSDEPTVCVGDLNQNEGTIIQPNENNQFTCTWERTSSRTNETVALSIESKFKVAMTSSQCKGGALIGVTSGSNEIGVVCGTTEYPKTIRSPYQKTEIYASLSSYYGPGTFTIKYKVHPCGGVISGEGYLRSPNYPNKYKNIVDCTWLIKLPDEQRINISTIDIDLGGDCNKNYITIYSGSTPKSPKIGSFCKKQQINFTSPNNYLWIDYHGDENSDGKGFEIKYEPYVTVCQSLSAAEMLLQSPSFPNRYPNNIECNWDIIVDDGYHIGMEFERFQLEESEKCNNDYLEFLQYINDEWSSLGKYCGRNNPSYVNSTTNRVRVIFRTNDKISGFGFRFKWKRNCGGQLVADSTKRYVISPGYPNNYENDVFCTYNITSSGYINVDFEEFDLESNAMCEYDRLRVYTPNEMISFVLSNPKSYCGLSPPGPIRNQGRVILEFRTDHWVTRKGFKFTYMSDECGGVINQKEMKISSPSRMNSLTGKVTYMNSLDCMWNITAPKDKNVVVRFTTFELEHQYNCIFDVVSIYNNFTLMPSSRLARLCGNLTENLPTIQSRGNKMLIKMKTDYTNHYKGFEAYIYFTYGSSIGCGGTVNISKTDTKTLQVSSGYSMVDCHWEIFAPQDHIIKIEVDNFIAEKCATNTSCACQILEVRDGASSSGESMAKICTSISNKKIYFTSDRYGWVRYGLKQGNTNIDNFKVKVSVIPSLCGERNLVVKKEKRYLTSPNYPNLYPDNVKCTWVLKTDKKIYLNFIDFDLDKNAKDLEVCKDDRLEIAGKSYNSYSLNALGPETVFKGSVLAYPPPVYKGSTVSMGIHQFCGSLSTTFDYYTWGDEISVSFYSGTLPHGKGFKIMYMTAGCNRNYTELQGRIFDHNPDENCHITINVPQNLTISIYFLNFYFIDSPSCNSAGFEVKDLVTGKTLARLCGRSIPNPIFSLQNSVSIHVWTKQRIAGFYDLLYTTTAEGRGCGGFLYNYFGRFSSPLYPGYYQKYHTCTWEIRVPQGLETVLTFTTFNMPANDCETDYVTVTTYDGDQSTNHKFCGETIPATLRSNNRMTVVYETTSSNSGSWVAYFAGVTKNAKLSL